LSSTENFRSGSLDFDTARKKVVLLSDFVREFHPATIARFLRFAPQHCYTQFSLGELPLAEEIQPVYTAADVNSERLSEDRSGEYPYTRGIQPTMYSSRLPGNGFATALDSTRTQLVVERPLRPIAQKSKPAKPRPTRSRTKPAPPPRPPKWPKRIIAKEFTQRVVIEISPLAGIHRRCQRLHG